MLEKAGILVVTDNIIQRKGSGGGYGPARMQLRELTKKHFPRAHWMVYFDADERIDPADYHFFRWLKDYLNEDSFDVLAFPRIDWLDKEKTESANDIRVKPDFQSRMSRLDSPIRYIRPLHERCIPAKNIYANIDTCPPIHHFHRSASQEKRDQVGMVCSMLHDGDTEFGHTYPKHHKEEYYQKMLKERGGVIE